MVSDSFWYLIRLEPSTHPGERTFQFDDGGGGGGEGGGGDGGGESAAVMIEQPHCCWFQPVP